MSDDVGVSHVQSSVLFVIRDTLSIWSVKQLLTTESAIFIQCENSGTIEVTLIFLQ